MKSEIEQLCVVVNAALEVKNTAIQFCRTMLPALKPCNETYVKAIHQYDWSTLRCLDVRDIRKIGSPIQELTETLHPKPELCFENLRLKSSSCVWLVFVDACRL